jgi:hypothetical protein
MKEALDFANDPVFIALGLALLGVFGVLAYAMALQRKAMRVQGDGMSKVDESLALAREAIELAREQATLARDLVAEQRETNRLLGQLVEARRRDA